MADDNRSRGIYPDPEIQARGEANRGQTVTTGGSSTGAGPETRVQDGYVWQKVFNVDPITGDQLPTFTWERVGPAKDAASGGGRNDALSAAQAALSGYLQAQSLADARKLAAMENFQKLSKFALPPGATQAPGYEPGGLAHTLAARQGLKEYRAPAITPATVNPGDVAGQIPPEVLAMIGGIRSAGGA